MFQGFYIITEDCIGEKTNPSGWTGKIKEGTPVAMTYFDETGMEFTTGEIVEEANYRDGLERIMKEFRLEKPCPVVAACSCPHCGKIVPTVTIKMHIETDENCRRIWEMKHEKEDRKVRKMLEDKVEEAQSWLGRGQASSL